MRILVTGAAGFIASNLIPRLLGKGHEVIGIDNFFLGRKAHVEAFASFPGFRFIQRDLLDLDGLCHILLESKPERVWHLAANSDISFGTLHTDFDLKGGTIVTYNLLEAMRRSGCRELLFSSSGAIYGEPTIHPTPENYGPLFPISLYAASKLACEGLSAAYAHNYDIQAWIFRFGNVIGPNPTHGVIHDFLIRLLQDPTRLKILGDGEQAKPYIHVEDCLDGMMYGQTHATGRMNCYNLAVPDQTSVNKIAAWCLEELGIDQCAFEYTGGSRGWKGDVAFVDMDTARMTALGWSPLMGSDQAVRRTIREIAAQLRLMRTQGGLPKPGVV
jgi:UDP-glucose 4-epimerase